MYLNVKHILVIFPFHLKNFCFLLRLHCELALTRNTKFQFRLKSLICFFFRYQTLATATDDAKQDNDTMAMSGKRIVADWVLGLGEKFLKAESCAINFKAGSVLVPNKKPKVPIQFQSFS